MRASGSRARDVGGGERSVAIIHHPDVRRMLMLMKSQTEAMRALAYVVAAAYDRAERHPDDAERARSQAFVDLLIPVVKGWSTETGVEVASLGVQVHGGMGYIEETGAAQYLRDVRITTIYEGTTGIQANDLIGRKIARDGGATINALVGHDAGRRAGELAASGGADFIAIEGALRASADALEQAAVHIVDNYDADTKGVSVGAVPFLKLLGTVAGGWQLAREALAAKRGLANDEGDGMFLRSKIATARFFADHVLAGVPGLAHIVIHGAAGALALAEEQF